MLQARPNWFYINGKFFNPSGRATFDVVNPATEQVMYKMPLGKAQDVDDAVKAATIAFKTFSKTSREERIELMERVISSYKKRMNDFGQYVSQEMGAPLDFAVKQQAGSGLAHLETFLHELKSYEFEATLGNFLASFSCWW